MSFTGRLLLRPGNLYPDNSFLSHLYTTALRLRGHEKTVLFESYGVIAGSIIGELFPRTAVEYERIQRVLLRGSDEEVLRFRDSVTNECNMTAIAGAIIAQVALTALSLPNLSLAHWTARAFLLFATVAGCMSVYYACILQRDIAKLNQPEHVRQWLRMPSRIDPTETETGEKKDPKASLSTIFVLSAPFTMMSYAIWAFGIGLAIYQGFTWTRTLDTDAGKANGRKVFIAFIVSSGYGLFFFWSAEQIKLIEEMLLSDFLRTKVDGLSLNKMDQSEFRTSLQDLDEIVAELQQLFDGPIQNRTSSSEFESVARDFCEIGQRLRLQSGRLSENSMGRFEVQKVVKDCHELKQRLQQRVATPTTTERSVAAAAAAATSSHDTDIGPPELRRDANNDIGGLTAALQAAAEAHIISAEADHRVALEYAKMAEIR